MSTCDTCPAPSAGIISFIQLDHSHVDYEACVVCATDAVLNSLANVAWTVRESGASIARGVQGAA